MRVQVDAFGGFCFFPLLPFATTTSTSKKKKSAAKAAPQGRKVCPPPRESRTLAQHKHKHWPEAKENEKEKATIWSADRSSCVRVQVLCLCACCPLQRDGKNCSSWRWFLSPLCCLCAATSPRPISSYKFPQRPQPRRRRRPFSSLLANLYLHSTTTIPSFSPTLPFFLITRQYTSTTTFITTQN